MRKTVPEKIRGILPGPEFGTDDSASFFFRRPETGVIMKETGNEGEERKSAGRGKHFSGIISLQIEIYSIIQNKGNKLMAKRWRPI